eukprot:NODE_3165_length_698_cov_93.098613_g2245_i0.p4 GENE.NODE_3165_length_698_cov_93.098613_g2245_i0~~NODE_3165_length_698_cov_93.098613_g2245_i0.p4  ORF type:complete len:58 (+),score=21.52 NODE_3165_length_698_cov_93.098613_g2245_i0:26-175(+)
MGVYGGVFLLLCGFLWRYIMKYLVPRCANPPPVEPHTHLALSFLSSRTA